MAAGSPLNRLHYFEVYKEGRKTWIYRQPHFSERVISEGVSRLDRVLELGWEELRRVELDFVRTNE